MAAIVLGGIGSAIGGSIGGSILGLSAAAIGGGIGSLIGTTIDSRLNASFAPDQRQEGARLDELRVTSATEGAVIPRIYGRMRVGGNIIWATDFREVYSETRQGGGGKGGGGGVVVEDYSYFASIAVAIATGPIGGVGRIWADGSAFDVPGAIWRLHRGTETQMPDPFIEATMGAGLAPAYRGTAYIVFENLPLAIFGNRLPQLSFEVYRPSEEPDSAEQLLTAVNMIPSSGEFIYATEPITRNIGSGAVQPENVNSSGGQCDFLTSLDQLEATAPNCKSVSLVVAWFGTDLRAGNCQIRPGVETATKVTAPKLWAVNGVSRSAAYVVSQIDGSPAYGGTPSDFSVVQAIQELKARGFRVTFYPFLLMDMPEANTLPSPYSDNAAALGQPKYPWRGRITCSPAAGFAGTVDKTAAAATQVSAFFGAAAPGNFAVSGTSVSWTGSPTDWGLRRMILHYAHLCVAAGGVDAFLIGSELRGLTQIRSGASTYPAVTAFQSLAASCRSILGAGTKLSYAADWSEYFGHQPQGGTGDLFFHLDPLWADANIDFIGIDNYMPLSDWRDGDQHLDALTGWPAIYDLPYLQSNIEGGEGFDWFYASDGDRTAQIRTPITDGTYGKPWVFRTKDLRSWWTNQHNNRPGRVESGSPTDWLPQSKPIRFTEAGAPAVDRGTNQPNVFYDPKSSESFLPYNSRGYQDDLVQRRYIEALFPYWNDPANNPASGIYAGRMIDVAEIAIWTWDARPYPAFPVRSDVWSDIDNYRLGHWLTGRIGGCGLAELVRELCRTGGVPDAMIDVTQLAATVPGYAITAIESARASIAPLAQFYGFDVVETGGQLRFVPRGQPAVAQIAAETLVITERNAEDISFTRAQETELPRALKWRLMMPDEDYGALSVEARRITVDTARVRTEQFPIVYPAALADRAARRALHEEWVAREDAAFALPPSRLALDPTDVIRLEHDGRTPYYVLARITDGGARRIEAKRTDQTLYDLPPGPERTPAFIAPTVFGPPAAILMNLPQLADDIPAHRPYAAVFAAPWYGSALIWRSPSTDGFTALGTVGQPARLGTLAFDFYAGPVWRFDNGNELWIDMASGTFSSLDDEALLAGGNALAIETAPDAWEIVQFATASLQSPGRWRLTHLLRGQFGTESSIANPTPAGARVVVLNTAVTPIAISESDIGLPANWRIGPSTAAAADPLNLQLAFTPSGRGLRPLRLSEIPNMAPGDTVQIDGDIYEIRSEPRRDAQRMILRCEARLL
ncbi:glycoside hydrolase/phage tail family protein [Pseudogemmobacter sp. W21_MBD1_M6]